MKTRDWAFIVEMAMFLTRDGIWNTNQVAQAFDVPGHVLRKKIKAHEELYGDTLLAGHSLAVADAGGIIVASAHFQRGKPAQVKGDMERFRCAIRNVSERRASK